MSENFFAHTSCIILSAGSSQRMGMHKALLKFDNNHTFLSKIAETYAKVGVEQILVVVNAELLFILKQHQFMHEKVVFVLNENPELGRFYSLQKGIQQLIPNNHCFFQNIDNPLVTEKVLESLIRLKNEADVLIPVFENKPGHPVLFSPHVAHKIHRISDYEIRIDNFLKSFAVLKVRTNDNSVLLNINLMEEYLEMRPKMHGF